MYPRVTVSLTGGLGNQMFQYSAARALSLKNSVPLYLDASWYLRKFRPTVNTNRNYELGNFTHLANSNVIWPFPLPTKIASGRSFFKNERVIKSEITQPVQLSRETIDQPVRMTGTWQNSDYFSKIRTELISEFKVDETPEILSNPDFLASHSNNTVAMHVRRGDYATHEPRPWSNQCLPIQYFQDALEFASNTVTIEKVLIVSDDPEWCRENFKGQMFHIAAASNTAIMDFQLLKNCRDHIISNSTFSWWAAWLGESGSRLVIAPKQWYHNGHGFASIPNYWVTL